MNSPFIITNDKVNIKDNKKIVPLINPLILNNSINEKKLNKNLNEQKLLYWEYGNSGIKIKNFSKLMIKNLAILYYIDKTFSKLLINNKKILISDLFHINTTKQYDIDENSISILNGIVNVNIKHKKISGIYNIIACGVTKISNINISENDLVKNKIPNLDSLLLHIDNIKHILKITNIFNIPDKFIISTNNSIPEFDFNNIIIQTKEIITKYKNDDKEKKILNSNSSSAFYIKIYKEYGKGFIIDGYNKLIYYIVEYENNNIIELRYYVLKISDDWKIICI